MAHVYASLALFNDFLRDTGSTTFATESALISGRKLTILEAVSRDIDTYCDRSRFGSGFGPRTGTNRYDGNGGSCLELDDDLLTLSSITVLDATAGSPVTFTDETDLYQYPYDATQKRRLVLHGQGANTLWTRGLRTVRPVGTWGYSNLSRVASTITNEAMDSSETGLDVVSGTEFSPGMTILIGTEQMYITAVSTNTLTVKRGQNGTTAASSSSGSAISIYEYPAEVVDCQLRVSLRRWKARDAGADGSDGGGAAAITSPQQSERTIMRQTVGHLRLPSVG